MSLGYLLPHVETAIFSNVENKINFFPTSGFCKDNALQAEGGNGDFRVTSFTRTANNVSILLRQQVLKKLTYTSLNTASVFNRFPSRILFRLFRFSLLQMNETHILWWKFHRVVCKWIYFASKETWYPTKKVFFSVAFRFYLSSFFLMVRCSQRDKIR